MCYPLLRKDPASAYGRTFAIVIAKVIPPVRTWRHGGFYVTVEPRTSYDLATYVQVVSAAYRLGSNL